MKEISLMDHCAIVECPGDIFEVVAGDSSWNCFEYDNYRDAEKKYEELKGTGFCSVQLVLKRVLVSEVNNGYNDE